MKITVTTSNAYINHILPVFIFLFNKYWGKQQHVEVVGYDAPNFNMPDNFSFYSHGKQSDDKQNFTRDIRKYFDKQDQNIIWMMEDTFITQPVDIDTVNFLSRLTELPDIGRINLKHEVTKQDHTVYGEVDGKVIYENSPVSLYRLSTQPSIWNRNYALQYMQKDLTPWEFECQSDYQVDKWHILGLDKDHSPLVSNEGVRKRDIHEFNLDGIDQSTINEMKGLGII